MSVYSIKTKHLPQKQVGELPNVLYNHVLTIVRFEIAKGSKNAKFISVRSEIECFTWDFRFFKVVHENNETKKCFSITNRNRIEIKISKLKNKNAYRLFLIK